MALKKKFTISFESKESFKKKLILFKMSDLSRCVSFKKFKRFQSL